MRARETWAGGHWSAAQRAAFIDEVEQPEPVEQPDRPVVKIATAPLIECLSPESLKALASLGYGR